jgi:uncharacterized membrane protein YphA (DoxX/SURF4 family)
MKLTLPKQLIVDIAAGLFILLFMYTAIMKLKDIHLFIGSMSHTPLLRPYATLLAGLIPGVEIAISIALIIPSTRYMGLVLATGLMGVFTLYVGLILHSMKELPCTCGGVLQQMNWQEHFLFNISFLTLGLAGIHAHKKIIAINRSSRTPVKESRHQLLT